MFLRLLAGQYALVVKLDVADLDAATGWYESKLGCIVDPRFSTETWRQVIMPGILQAAIGLNLNAKGGGSGSETTTFVVHEIQAARQALISKGVDVTPIQDVGAGVLLAFFKDLDGNEFGLRQNGSMHPQPSKIGHL